LVALIGRVFVLGLALLAAGCGKPSLGDTPALCSADGACPEGYDCIHGVCALPGTPVPITVGSSSYLRGSDLRLIPQTTGVLVAWETYAYSEEGQGFVGARVAPDGAVSSRMDLVGVFPADEDSLEPYFDLIPVQGDRVLVAISSSPLSEDTSAMPRLITYRVSLPPEGKESESPSFEPAWSNEIRLDTVGYGAVSVPRLLRRADHLELGYVRTRVTTVNGSPETVAELARFSLAEDGSLNAQDPTYHPARLDLPVAVGVWDAFAFTGGSWWILDNERPSAVFVPDAGGEAEVKLGRLGIPVEADGSSLVYIEPSARGGDKLPADPVVGPAALRKVAAPMIGGPAPVETSIGALPELRDTPRPAWIHREGKSSLLVTPGAAVDAPELSVLVVEPQAGAVKPVASIPRLSTRKIDALRAAIVGSNLFVVWLETDAESATIRAAIVPEPQEGP